MRERVCVCVCVCKTLMRINLKDEHTVFNFDVDNHGDEQGVYVCVRVCVCVCAQNLDR